MRLWTKQDRFIDRVVSMIILAPFGVCMTALWSVIVFTSVEVVLHGPTDNFFADILAGYYHWIAGALGVGVFVCSNIMLVVLTWKRI